MCYKLSPSTRACRCLWPAELVVKDVDDDEGQRVQQIGHETRPEWEVCPEAGEEAHYGADKEDNEDLWGEIPRQTPHVDEAQEHGQAQRVVHGHPTVDLRLIKRMASQFTITLEYLKLMTGMQQKAFTKIPQRM